MTDEKIAELLKVTLLSKYDDDINDSVVDQLLSKSETDIAGDIPRRIKKRFIEKLVSEQIHAPIKVVEPQFTFGDFVETTRKGLKLSIKDLALALEENDETIERLEKGRILPWSCAPQLIGGLMRLIKLHYIAAETLINTTVATAQAKGPTYASARSGKGKMTPTRGDSTAKALSRFLAMKQKKEERPEEVSRWLGDLKETLASEGWRDLVDS